MGIDSCANIRVLIGLSVLAKGPLLRCVCGLGRVDAQERAEQNAGDVRGAAGFIGDTLQGPSQQKAAMGSHSQWEKLLRAVVYSETQSGLPG